MKLDKEIKEKRPEVATSKGVIFHQDNARPHTSLVTRKKVLELGWKMMHHPPYSPDLAPPDYHLFRSLQNHLNDLASSIFRHSMTAVSMKVTPSLLTMDEIRY